MVIIMMYVSPMSLTRGYLFKLMYRKPRRILQNIRKLKTLNVLFVNVTSEMYRGHHVAYIETPKFQVVVDKAPSLHHDVFDDLSSCSFHVSSTTWTPSSAIICKIN